jgi:hypothetical protein
VKSTYAKYTTGSYILHIAKGLPYDSAAILFFAVLRQPVYGRQLMRWRKVGVLEPLVASGRPVAELTVLEQGTIWRIAGRKIPWNSLRS